MLFQNLMEMLGQIPQLIVAEASNPQKVELLLERVLRLKEIFEADKLHPNSMALIYLSAAQFYMGMEDQEKALEYIGRYVDITGYFFPLKLHGDDFFQHLEEWIEELELGSSAPRDDALVKESIYEAVAENPLMESLKVRPDYQALVKRLKHKLGMED